MIQLEKRGCLCVQRLKIWKETIISVNGGINLMSSLLICIVYIFHSESVCLFWEEEARFNW